MEELYRQVVRLVIISHFMTQESILRNLQRHISSCRRSTCQCCSREGGFQAQQMLPHDIYSWPRRNPHASASCCLLPGWPGGNKRTQTFILLNLEAQNNFKGKTSKWKCEEFVSKFTHLVIVWVICQRIPKMFKGFLIFAELRKTIMLWINTWNLNIHFQKTGLSGAWWNWPAYTTAPV